MLQTQEPPHIRDQIITDLCIYQLLTPSNLQIYKKDIIVIKTDRKALKRKGADGNKYLYYYPG